MKYILQVFIYNSPVLKIQVGIPSLGCISHCGKHLAPPQGNATSHFPNSDFLTFHFLGCLLVRATFYTVSWEGTLCKNSVSKVSWASFQTLKIPSPPHLDKLWHHGTINLSSKGYFISFSCFSLFSQPQSRLLPCNITSDTFPVTRFFTACCRFFLNIWRKQSSHFSFHSTSLT